MLFNRFYQPDLDLESLEVVPRLELSQPWELRLPVRWIAILRPQLGPDVSLAATSGVHSGTDVVKGLLVGADVVMMTSALLRHGPEHVATVEAELRDVDGRARVRVGRRSCAAARAQATVERPVRVRARQLHGDAPTRGSTPPGADLERSKALRRMGVARSWSRPQPHARSPQAACPLLASASSGQVKSGPKAPGELVRLTSCGS